MHIARYFRAPSINVLWGGGSIAPNRIRSLDVFRGLCVVAMILVNTPGDVRYTYGWLTHAAWHGWSFADTIMPAFLWIVGLSVALSAAKRLEAGATRSELLKHAAKRSVLLFGCGLLLEGFPRYDPMHWELTGVLQLIAFAYFVGFVVHLKTGLVGQCAGILSVFAIYLALMLLYPVPSCGAGSWASSCNFARYLDEPVLGGHEWLTSQNDPFGLMSMLCACSSVLLGMLAGRLLLAKRGEKRFVLALLASGVALACAGLVLSNWIPINKTLWTPSYALLMAGLSSTAFAVIHAMVERRIPFERWFSPLEVFGMNAIVAYVASRILASPLKMHIGGKSIYADLMLPHAAAANASLMFAALDVLCVFMLVLWMFRRGIFVKL
jgi:predicted acyltransferase